MSDRYLNIPSGKSVKEIRGLYEYVGPRVLRIHRQLVLEDTFHDGTPISPFYSDKEGQLLTNKENPSNKSGFSFKKPNQRKKVEYVTDEPNEAPQEPVTTQEPQDSQIERRTPEGSQDESL